MLGIQRAFTTIYKDVRMKNVWCIIMEQIAIYIYDKLHYYIIELIVFARNRPQSLYS